LWSGYVDIFLKRKRGTDIIDLGYFRYDTNNQRPIFDVTLELIVSDEIYFLYRI